MVSALDETIKTTTALAMKFLLNSLQWRPKNVLKASFSTLASADQARTSKPVFFHNLTILHRISA